MNNEFSIARIVQLLRPAAAAVQVELVAETSSTNSDLLRAINPRFEPTLLIAEKQTDGRGRAGRSWYSESGSGLTFSLAWKFERTAQQMQGLPLAVGVAIADALGMYDVYVKLKWPNDVLRDGKKLAGVLIESTTGSTASEEHVWAVIGIGINLAVPDSLEKRVGQAVADATWLANVNRNELIAELLNNLAEVLVQFERQGFEIFVSRWEALHAYAGMQVDIVDHGKVLYEGCALGVNGAGCLLLETRSGLVSVIAGDVSLRVSKGCSDAPFG